MKILKKIKASVALFLIVLMQFIFIPLPKAYAATTRVGLLTTDNFAVLAGTPNITNVPTSVITGDVGLRPASGAGIGLTCAEVTGTIYSVNAAGPLPCRVTNDGLLNTAKIDLGTAYDDAAGRTTTATINTALGGVTLTDGVYVSTATTFEIAEGQTLTLDGGGNADAVFIFNMNTTLTTFAGSKVVLTNGAQACNVYWRVGSSATLGTSTTFIGNILALTDITDNGSSTVNGRLLARNGAVILNKTTVAKSTCAAGTAGGPALASSSTSSTTTLTNDTTSVPALAYCPPLNYVAPIIIESRRVDSDSIFVSWGPYSGINTFIVEYGPENGKWLYNTKVTGFSTTINYLPANQPIWVRIAASDYCSVGVYGESKLVGGPSLPNTGVAPRENNLLWSLLAGLAVEISVLLVSVHRFSSKQ